MGQWSVDYPKHDRPITGAMSRGPISKSQWLALPFPLHHVDLDWDNFQFVSLRFPPSKFSNGPQTNIVFSSQQTTSSQNIKRPTALPF